MKRLISTIMVAAALAGHAQDKTLILAPNHAMHRLTVEHKYLMLPVQESAEMSHVTILSDNQAVQQFNVRLAETAADYLVPVDIARFNNPNLLLDIVLDGDRNAKGSPANLNALRTMAQADTFPTQNTERFRPAYHHTPLYGWMNDPNGMFYKDGTYHLYYQYNPYGSQWENMTWGHSTSTDLIHWTPQPIAIEPDALGAIFSGSCVVDKEKNVVAFYTSAGRNQVQSMAVSNDNGLTFNKFALNPIITADVPDFRDPKVFWNSDIKAWNLILAAGQEMRIYSSNNLKDWQFESSFGKGYGCHDGVWECPDLIKIDGKWVLICNINPGGPFGGSATQYFVGDFDGKRFTTNQKRTLWLDYGKDHYATVTFHNAPQNRAIAIAWMSNWQYANNVPTKQFRSANSIPRDLSLFTVDGETYCASRPSPELLKLRSNVVKSPSETCEIVVDIKKDTKITLSNSRNEYVSISYNKSTQLLTFDRKHAGDNSFSRDFAAETSVKVPGGSRQLRIFIDRCSIELFDSDGKAAMTNLVFPSEPYSKMEATGGKTVIYQLTIDNGQLTIDN